MDKPAVRIAKLGCRDSPQLIALACETGLVTPVTSAEPGPAAVLAAGAAR